MVTIHDVKQGDEAWHALRAGKYTGSNAWKLLKYGAIDYALTERSTFNGNFYTKRGHVLEDEAVELGEAILRCRIDRPGFVTNDRFPTCGYSPDGIIERQTLIEVKCFKEEKHLKIYKEGPTFEILAQVHFGMLITELKQAKLLIYNPDLDDPKKCFKVIDIAYNRNVQNNFKRLIGKEASYV